MIRKDNMRFFAYEKILHKVNLKVVDVTGLKWSEIDLPEEYEQAKVLFGD